MLEIVEYLYVDMVIRTLLLEEFTETIGEVILLCELEDWFVYLFAEPYYSLADKFRSPFAWSDKPRGHVSGKKRSRILLNKE